jgi:hypothetical protein
VYGLREVILMHTDHWLEAIANELDHIGNILEELVLEMSKR